MGYLLFTFRLKVGVCTELKKVRVMEKKDSKITLKEIRKSFRKALSTQTFETLLQERDYAIMRFILEQKFASLEAIYFRFFDVRKHLKDPLPKNFWTTRQRLSKLRKYALLRTEKVLSSGKAHFLLTPLGYKVVKDYLDESVVIKPAKSIDFSLYEHDVRVSMLRAFLERKGKANRWHSEKWLKGNVFYVKKYGHKFSKDLRPDAIFINSKGERIALELEMSRKGSRRLEEKIRLYDELLKPYQGLSLSSSRPKILDKVWVVVTTPSVYRSYRKAIFSVSRDRLLYRIDSYKDVIPECARGRT